MSRATRAAMWVLVGSCFAGLGCFLAVPRYTPATFRDQARAALPPGTPRADAEEWFRWRGGCPLCPCGIGWEPGSMTGVVPAYRLGWLAKMIGWPAKMIYYWVTFVDGKVVEVNVASSDEVDAAGRP